MIYLKRFWFIGGLPLLVLSFLAGCEMEDEVQPTPEVVINSPQAGESFIRGTPIEVSAWLKGFTEDFNVHRTTMRVDDSLLLDGKKYQEQVGLTLQTGRLAGQSHQITVEVDYTKGQLEDQNWNFFSLRDYMGGDSEKADTLQVKSSVAFSFGSPDGSQPAIDVVEFPPGTLYFSDDTVHIDSFAMSPYEVTNQQYAGFLNAIKADSLGRYAQQKYIFLSQSTGIIHRDSTFAIREGMGNLPVINVTWHGAQAFCRWMGGRLPTQWEWLMAAGTSYTYSGSDNAGEVAWYQANADGRIHPVGQKDPNSDGMYDMSGNAGEWCLNGREQDKKAYRGGHWKSTLENLPVVRSFQLPPDNAGNFLGFRLLIPR